MKARLCSSRMGGEENPQMTMSHSFARPLSPRRALNAAATTTDGSTKGMVVHDWIRLLPGKR